MTFETPRLVNLIMTFNVKTRLRRLTGLITASCALAGLTCLANPPPGLIATPGTNQVNLNWNAEAGATNYVIQRSLDLNGTYTIIANTDMATNFTDTTVSYGMTYYYAVAAVNDGTTSAYTPPVSAVSVSAYALPNNLPFAKGADVSWVSQMEADGYTWKNRDGTTQDIFQILTNLGVNAARFRVWVNPPAGYNNQADVIAKAVRANNARMRVLIDFHYSDTWADPGHQTKPAAWAGFTVPQLVAAVSNHTYDVMSGLLAAGVTPAWVQVGNEIPCGILWPEGNNCVSSTNWPTLAAMLNAGYDAVKAVSPGTRVILHLNDGQSNYRWWFDPIVNLGVRFDVIGMSVYPTTTTNWISDTTAAFANMLDVSARYGKEVIVAETGMDASAAQACQDMLVSLMNKTRAVPNGKGIGVFYWEPEGYAYWGQSAWNNDGTPTIAMDAFAYEPNQPPGSPALNGTTTAGQIQLTWTTPVGATEFLVKRATVNGGPYTVIASLTATNYTDTPPQSETTYYYVIAATNSFGIGADSAPVSATFGAPVLAASLTGDGQQLVLAWPTSAANYAAFSATNLTPPIAWTPVTNAASSSNGMFHLFLPIGGGDQFFRLSTP